MAAAVERQCAIRQNRVVYRRRQPAPGTRGLVERLVGIEGGVVSEVINLESSGVGAPDRRPRHEQQYHEDTFSAV